MSEQIAILLFDDIPFATESVGGNAIAALRVAGAETRQYERKLKALFRLLWLYRPEEMREYYYLVRQLAERRPEELGELAVIPEVAVFDFALTSSATNDPPTDEQRGESNPLPRLREAVSELCEQPGVATADPLPNLGYPPGEDRFGCYAGGLVSLQFSDYACVGVPTTIYPGKEETGFFQWFLQDAFFGAFDRQSRGAPTWPLLLREGLNNLRKRIEQRLGEGTVRPAMNDLLQLTGDTPLPISEWLSKTLTLHSRYGTRSLPLEALFFDLLYPDPAANPLVPCDCSDEVAAWAKRCLMGMLRRGRCARGELMDALHVAKTFQACYDSVFQERLQLSEALFTPTNYSAANLPAEVQALAQKWGLDTSRRDLKATVTGGPTLGTVKAAANDNPVVARLAALFCVVWAESRARLAVSNRLRKLIVDYGVLDSEDDRSGADEVLLKIQELIERHPLIRSDDVVQLLAETRHAVEAARRQDEVDEETNERNILTYRQSLRKFEDKMTALRGYATTDRVYDILAPSPKRASLWRQCKPQTARYLSRPFASETTQIRHGSLKIQIGDAPEVEIRIQNGCDTPSALVAEMERRANAVSVALEVRETEEKVKTQEEDSEQEEEGKTATKKQREVRIQLESKWGGESLMLSVLPDGTTVAGAALIFDMVRSHESGTADASSDVTSPLKRLHSTSPQPGGWGDLGLSIDDVLHPVTTDKNGRRIYAKHGLRAGEGVLLRMYADYLQFDRRLWPDWLRSAV